MATIVNKFATVETILASAVADDATFTVGYPSGTTQASFSNGLALSTGVMIVDDVNRYAEGASGFTASFGVSDITITNTTGASLPAGSAISFQFEQVNGNDVVVLSFPIPLVAITAAGDVLTNFTPGIAGTIEAFSFAVTRPVTTASRLASLNLEIDTTNVTGGVIALTSAAATPLGKVIASTAITGANVLTETSTLSIEAASVTAFAEGEGVALIRIRRTPSNVY